MVKEWHPNVSAVMVDFMVRRNHDTYAAETVKSTAKEFIEFIIPSFLDGHSILRNPKMQLCSKCFIQMRIE
jgi:hypothetical protein